MAARHRPFRESKVEKDRREAKEREEEKLALSKKALTQPYNVYDEWDKYKKDYNVKIPAGPAASMEFVLTSTTPGASGKELVSSAEELRIELEDFAKKVEDIKTLWNVLRRRRRRMQL